MKSSSLSLIAMASFFVLSGCAMFVSPSSFNSLESRVQHLENKFISLEEDNQAPADIVSGAPGSEAKAAGSEIKASEMSKKDIQRALKSAGYYGGEVDGKIGPGTRAAIREFQSDNGLKVDGVAGINTKRKLAEYL